MFIYGMKIIFREREQQRSDTLVVPNARGFSNQETENSPFITLVDELNNVAIIVNQEAVLYIAPLMEKDLA